jgi:hypothetical protein
MKKIFLNLIISTLLLLLAACQAGPQAGATATPPPQPAAVLLPSQAPTQESGEVLPAPLPSPSGVPTLDPTAAPTPDATALAVQSLKEYFAALQAGNSTEAARLTSNLSLMVDGTTRDEWAIALKNQMDQGTKWSGLEVKDARVFTDNTVLVHVVYQLTKKEPKTGAVTQSDQDELWPVRLENGKWFYNRANLIDFRGLVVPDHTTAGLLVQPQRLIRYSDHISLVFLAQNSTNDPIVLGQPNEILATFFFGDQKVETNTPRFIFDRLRSYPNTVLNVPGLFTSYPDGVEIRRWKSINVAPWFVFHFDA